jgi:hypothetical protein
MLGLKKSKQRQMQQARKQSKPSCIYSTFQLKIIQDTNKNFERPLSFISSNQKNIFGAEFSLDKEISAI